MKNHMYDYEKAIFILESFAYGTDIECRLVDEDGKTIHHVNPKCQFLYAKLSLDEKPNEESFTYSAYQAVQFGGSYIFFGPYGLVYFTTPIMHHQNIIGAFVGGPLLMMAPDDYLYQTIIRKSLDQTLELTSVKSSMAKVPYVPTKRVKYLADLLFISNSFTSPEQHEQFDKAKQLMSQRSEVVHYIGYLKTMGGTVPEGEDYPLDKEKDLLSLISIGDQEGANRLLNEIMAHVYISYRTNFDKLKSRALELVVLLSRAALEGGAQVEEIFGLNYSYLNDIHHYHSVDDLSCWLSEICKRFTNSVFKFGEAKHTDAIYKAMDYIKRHYMQKLTLEEVAEHVFFSPPYFSRIFKNEMGITFNKYLNKVRIANSKQLLNDKDMSLADISEAVGFHDQSHFSKMFKSITETSPKKYREAL